MNVEDEGPGPWLQQLRINAGRSRMQVATQGGINHRTVERVETGHYGDPRWSTIKRILTGIGVESLNPIYGAPDRKDHVQPTLDDVG